MSAKVKLSLDEALDDHDTDLHNSNIKNIVAALKHIEAARKDLAKQERKLAGWEVTLRAMAANPAEVDHEELYKLYSTVRSDTPSI